LSFILPERPVSVMVQSELAPLSIAGSGLGRAATNSKVSAELFLVVQGFAVGADLDFGLFAGGDDFGLVGDDLAMLGD
jgi:hypothetical protein